MTLAERIVALHEALDAAGLPHAFGGAIALAYWTLDPRGTNDIDLNVFVPEREAARVVASLPDGVRSGAADISALAETGQARLWWEDVPIDLFLDYLPLHHAAERHRRTVPFAGSEIPVLGPVELAVFKAMFDRTRDWADLEAMASAGTLDVEAVVARVREVAGDGDERVDRVREAARRGAAS